MSVGQKIDGSGVADLPISADGKSIPVTGTLTAVIDESTLATNAKQDTGNTSLASIDGKVSAAAAAGDTDANPTVGGIRAFLEVFNGTNWQRVRNGITAVSATLTGMLNTLPWAIFHTAPTTRTDGQGGPIEADALGNIQINLATKIAGEDITNDVMKTEGQFTYDYQAGITTGRTLKTGAGVLARINITTPLATAVVTFYDNTAASGTKIFEKTFPAALVGDPPCYVLDVKFATGLTIVVATANAVVTTSFR